MGSQYNTEKDCDGNNHSDATLAEMDLSHTDNTEKENLDKELSLSAVIFTVNEDESQCDKPPSFDVQGVTFEDAMETEALRYVGGSVVKKYPQYEFLGSPVEKDDNTWISAISRCQRKLKKTHQGIF